MSTHDVKNSLIPGNEPSDEVVQTFFRQFLPDFYFVNAPVSRMRHHLTILKRLPEQPVLVDFNRPTGANFTELTLCAKDDAEPGLLSKVAGTLAALKINVHTAWIHTLNNPYAPDSGHRVVLDTLILSEPYFRRSRPLSLKTQQRITMALTRILNGQETVAGLLAKDWLRSQAPLVVNELAATPTSDGYTLIKLCASDDNGVLYIVTRALAAIGLNVFHAQINTSEKAVDDVFFVQKCDGSALREEETAGILEQLRYRLQRESFLDDDDSCGLIKGR